MGKFHVLLVDDEQEFVKALAERLEIRQLRAAVAFSGEEALQVLEMQTPDVMVLDLKMPGMDGLDVLRRVKRDHPQIQVILLTGHGSDKDREAAERLGAFEYLHKPVEIECLVEILKRAYLMRTAGG